MQPTTFGEFEGTFYFTNPDTEEFVHLWNNKEYRFPAESTVPLIIMGEPLENIQEIRKRFAYDNAVKRFFKGTEYERLSKMGNGIPPTFNEKLLEPMIEECLKPLQKTRAIVTEGKKDSDRNYKATKALKDSEDPNRLFSEENANVPILGVMSE